ncbi:MAG: hypothetical protein U0Q11_27820 [Vicinamibacterales bacterium]
MLNNIIRYTFCSALSHEFSGERMSPIAAAVHKLREVYLEAPSSRLSARDASQIAGLEPATCQIILEVLAEARFLSQSPEGVFVRRPDPPVKRAS